MEQIGVEAVLAGPQHRIDQRLLPAPAGSPTPARNCAPRRIAATSAPCSFSPATTSPAALSMRFLMSLSPPTAGFAPAAPSAGCSEAGSSHGRAIRRHFGGSARRRQETGGGDCHRTAERPGRVAARRRFPAILGGINTIASLVPRALRDPRMLQVERHRYSPVPGSSRPARANAEPPMRRGNLNAN